MPIYAVQSDRLAAGVYRSLRRRLARAVALLAACIAVFTLGFYLIDIIQDRRTDPATGMFDALWNTLNLVSTVGSLERITILERAWAMLAIVIGLGAVLYGFGSLQALLHGDMARLLERRRMKRMLSGMSDHIVLCGYGRVGQGVAAVMRRHGTQVVVVDKDPDAVARADEDGCMAVLGDCDDEQTLRDAGLERATGLISALDTDAGNVYLILIARELRPGLRIVSRAERAESCSTLMRAGADRAVAPGDLAALQLSHLMLKPIVSEFIAAATGEGEFDFAELQVAEHPGLHGRSLGELDLPHSAGAIVISVVSGTGEQEFNPPRDRTLGPRDTLLVVCRAGGLERIAALR